MGYKLGGFILFDFFIKFLIIFFFVQEGESNLQNGLEMGLQKQ